jgi:hypothetical protein
MAGREKPVTETDAATTQAALVEAALRLVDNYPDVTAGSVLRCYSRAVKLMRRAGTPAAQLATRAEVLARQMLSARNGPDVRRRATLREELGIRTALFAKHA